MRKLNKHRFVDWGLTLAALASLIAAIAWLDNSNPLELSGSIKVVDGDSLIINQQMVRLLGIDAPELNQVCTIDGKSWNCGYQAMHELRKLVLLGDVKCTSTSQDVYQRQLAVCKTKNAEINERLVLEGWAVNYGGYSKQEASARKQGLGLWRGDFLRPSDWRRKHPTDDAKSIALVDKVFDWLKRRWPTPQ